jgi:hypothetical protein
MNAEGFETVSEMNLEHLPNDAKLVLQRQKSDIIGDKIQFGLPSTFVNPDNHQTVWCKGPSIQVQQIPELIDMLTKTYEKYTGCKLSENKSEKSNTFADMLDQ